MGDRMNDIDTNGDEIYRLVRENLILTNKVKRLLKWQSNVRQRWCDYMRDGNNAVVFDNLADAIQRRKTK
jgi:hypothetical protein